MIMSMVKSLLYTFLEEMLHVEINAKCLMLKENNVLFVQVNLFYEQLDGLEVGWRYGVDRSRKDFNIPHADFL